MKKTPDKTLLPNSPPLLLDNSVCLSQHKNSMCLWMVWNCHFSNTVWILSDNQGLLSQEKPNVKIMHWKARPADTKPTHIIQWSFSNPSIYVLFTTLFLCEWICCTIRHINTLHHNNVYQTLRHLDALQTCQHANGASKQQNLFLKLQDYKWIIQL